MAEEIVFQVLKALVFLEARNAFHGSISPDNILVDQTGQVNLADFGLSPCALRLSCKKRCCF